jgi:hypothetical protein
MFSVKNSLSAERLKKLIKVPHKVRPSVTSRLQFLQFLFAEHRAFQYAGVRLRDGS